MAAERGVLDRARRRLPNPLGAFAERAGGTLRLRAFVADAEAVALRRPSAEPLAVQRDEAHDLGLSLGRELR